MKYKFIYESEGNMYFLWNSILSFSWARSKTLSLGTINLIPVFDSEKFGIFFGQPLRAKSVQVFIILNDSCFSSSVQYFLCAKRFP